jgi:hypothetical protein
VLPWRIMADLIFDSANSTWGQVRNCGDVAAAPMRGRGGVKHKTITKFRTSCSVHDMILASFLFASHLRC